MLPKGLPPPGRITAALRAFVAALACLSPAVPCLAASDALSLRPDTTLALGSVSIDVRSTIAWVMQEHDNQGKPFAIVDKKSAVLHVFDANGRLRGSSAVLLGLTPGDTAAMALDAADPERLHATDRTTPAGRFSSEPGHNLQGDAIVWVDYAAKLAIHRLRAAPAQERRAARLASATPTDNRISLGCVVVPEAFYDQVVAPVLGKSYGVVYVLPETYPLERLLGGLQLSLR